MQNLVVFLLGTRHVPYTECDLYIPHAIARDCASERSPWNCITHELQSLPTVFLTARIADVKLTCPNHQLLAFTWPVASSLSALMRPWRCDSLALSHPVRFARRVKPCVTIFPVDNEHVVPQQCQHCTTPCSSASWKRPF